MKVTLTMKPDAARSFIPIEAESIIPKNFSGTDFSVWRGTGAQPR